MENKQIYWLYRFTEMKAKVESLGFHVEVKSHAIALKKNEFFHTFTTIEEFVGFIEAVECLTGEGENLASHLNLQKTS